MSTFERASLHQTLLIRTCLLPELSLQSHFAALTMLDLLLCTLLLWCIAHCSIVMFSLKGIENETAAERRKREKLERKQNKVKYSKGRR